MSSIIAAPNIAFPALVFNFPISFKVSTVILTEVAVNIIPMNTFCNMALTSFPLLNILAIKNPPTRGIITPSTAIINDALPVFFNWLISVSKPAVNISTITPNSASF